MIMNRLSCFYLNLLVYFNVLRHLFVFLYFLNKFTQCGANTVSELFYFQFHNGNLFFVICLRLLQVSLSMTGIMAADSVSHTLQVQQWDGEVRQESKHAADLKQLDNGLKIPPR